MDLRDGIATVEGDTHIGKWVRDTGKLCHDTGLFMDLWPALHAAGYGPLRTIVDAGAFIGDHTAEYARQAKRVLAFEPNPVAFDCLEHNMQSFDNVECYPLGLSEGNSYTASLHACDNVGASHVTDDGAGRICLAPLDQYELDDLDFIKLDIEGMEPAALRGASGTMQLCRPAVLVEINHGALARIGYHPDDILGLLEDWKYRCRPFRGSYRDPQWDALCLPKERT